MGNKKGKIINILKNILFYIKIIFWVSISILSFGGAFMFLPDDIDEYKDDWQLMAEWREKQRKELKK